MIVGAARDTATPGRRARPAHAPNGSRRHASDFQESLLSGKTSKPYKINFDYKRKGGRPPFLYTLSMLFRLTKSTRTPQKNRRLFDGALYKINKQTIA